MTKRYFIRYFIETPNSVGNRMDIEEGKVFSWKFNFNNNEIGLYDHRHGLFVDCYIIAENQETAEKKLEILIENILNLIDFSTSSASNVLLFDSSYDATPNLSKRNYKQIFYIPISDRNVVVINEEIFKEIFHTINKNQDARIVRAISWLRKGYLEQKFIDKFVAFWIGLESINELLCDFLNITKENRKRKCNKCGNEISSVSLVGIKKLFLEKLKIDNDLFVKMRKARGKLLHGGGPLDDTFIEEVKKYIPLIRKALVMGIGQLLSIKNENIENILQKSTRLYNERLRIVCKTNLINFEPPALGEFNKQPRIDLSEQNLLNRVIDKDGKLNLKIKWSFIGKNATFNNTIIYELYGDDNTTLESSQFIDMK